MIVSKIRFIHIELIPNQIYSHTLEITSNIDIDDTEFVALTDHAKGKLWTGDKHLIQGLEKKNWKKTISTNELYDSLRKLKS